MQRMISHDKPLPRCSNNHAARHMHDLRRASAGGGHFIECACGCTARYPEFESALAVWTALNTRRPTVVAGNDTVKRLQRGGRPC